MINGVNKIEESIKEMEGGAFQKLCDRYLYEKNNWNLKENFFDSGSMQGTNKTTAGTPVSSDKEMAKVLFNGLLNGTLMSYLKDNSNVSVVVDHIDIDNSYGTTDTRLYLTWYWDINK